MIRLRNTDLDVLVKCQYTRTILTKKNMGGSLFKKQSKLQYPIKFFTVTRTKACTNNRKLLENIFTQKLLQERKL